MRRTAGSQRQRREGGTGTGRGHRQRIGDRRRVQEPAARHEADQLDESRAAELRQRQRQARTVRAGAGDRTGTRLGLRCASPWADRREPAPAPPQAAPAGDASTRGVPLPDRATRALRVDSRAGPADTPCGKRKGTPSAYACTARPSVGRPAGPPLADDKETRERRLPATGAGLFMHSA